MNGLALHLRQRGAGTLTLLIPVLLALEWTLGSRTIPLPLENGARAPLAILLPAITGITLATVMLPALPDSEALSARRLHTLNYIYTLTVAVATCIGAAALTPALDLGYSGVSTGRNTALMTGLAMIAAVTLGPNATWAAPSLYTGLVITLGSTAESTSPAWWALPLQRDTSGPATLVTVVLFMIGVALTARVGTPRSGASSSRLTGANTA